MIKWTTEQRKLSELVPWPRNPRQIDEAQSKRLGESFDEFGQVETIAIGPHNEVYNGHQRINVLLDHHGPDFEIDVRVSSRSLTEKEREKLTVFLHRGATGEWDFDLLESEFNLDELLEWGFDEDELNFDAESKNAEPQIDDAEDLQEKWKTKLGQLWQFGQHKLFVGPAEQAGIECDLAIYDPPFDWSWQQQDNALSWSRWRKAALIGLHYCMPLVQRTDFLHWWIWDSGIVRFGGRGYKPMSGCSIVLVFGEKRIWYESQALSVMDRHGIEHYDWPAQVVKIQDSLQNRDFLSHQKPYPLYEYVISLYSKQHDLIGDPFAGSGGFLIAAENLKRQYHGAEIDPQSAAVILERWFKTFETEPILINDAA